MVVKIPHICAPIEYDKYLDGILVGIYKVGKPATSREIGEKLNRKDFTCIGRACSFLSYLGLTTGKHSPFDLSPQGRQIAIAFHENKLDKASELWKQTLRKHELYAELKKYIEAQGGGRGSSQGFAEHLKTFAKGDWKGTSIKEGGKRLCALFSGKELLDFNRTEDSISFPSTSPPSSAISQLSSPPEISPTPTHPSTSEGTSLQEQKKSPTNVLSYNITITVEARDAQSIKEVISLVKELKEQKLSN